MNFELFNLHFCTCLRTYVVKCLYLLNIRPFHIGLIFDVHSMRFLLKAHSMRIHCIHTVVSTSTLVIENWGNPIVAHMIQAFCHVPATQPSWR